MDFLSVLFSAQLIDTLLPQVVLAVTGFVVTLIGLATKTVLTQVRAYFGERAALLAEQALELARKQLREALENGTPLALEFPAEQRVSALASYVEANNPALARKLGGATTADFQRRAAAHLKGYVARSQGRLAA